MMNFSNGEFCWNELVTPNVKKSKDFYGKMFGWQFNDVELNDMIYTLITCQNKEIAGIWQIPSEQQDQIPPHWMAYILVDNLEDSLEKAKQLGAEIKRDVTQVGDMGRLGIIIDPTGAPIALWESKK